jgi:fructose-1,6-bisphosphatase I
LPSALCDVTSCRNSSVGLAGEQNVQGEDQKKLDVLSNDIMVNALRASGKTSVLVSEELEEAVVITDKRLKGN